MKHDNCIDCASKCEHAGKDREFVCKNGVSCKVKKSKDIVEVVRCKDCVKRGTEYCSMYYQCNCGEQHTWESDNDFCSYGERKEK